MSKIDIELKNAIKENNLVLFVGAGLSFNLVNTQNQQIKGWSNLVACILDDLEKKGYDVGHLIPLLKKYDPIKILDLIESDKTLPKKEIYKYAKDFFELSNTNNLDLQRKLFQLSRKIITTNYDTAFEEADPVLRRNKAYKGKNYELTTHKDKDAVLLFKLHGCSEDADSMILFPSNYRNLYENKERDAEHSLLVLKNIIMNKNILFIGTGMGDFQINNIFSEVKRLQSEYNQKHFIITNKGLDSSLDFLTPITISDFTEIGSIIDELLIIKKEAEDNVTQEVKLLKKQLDDTQKRLEQLDIEKYKEELAEKNRLLEREALRYFTKGVEYSLSNEYLKAFVEYNNAIELKPDLHQAFYNWGCGLGNLAQTKQGKEAEDLYRQAFEKFQQAIDIKPDLHEAFYNWGCDLGNLAQTKQGKEAEDLYRQAFEKFQQAIDIKPDLHEAFNNWGTNLGNLAQTKHGNEAEDLYRQAFEKFQQAIDIKPDLHEAFYNWGTNLGNLAQTKHGKEAEDLYRQAFEKFQQAIDIKPDKHEAFYNWGTYLGNLAQTKQGKEAEDLYRQAFEKFQQAIDIKPDKHEAFNNWGCDLGNLAQTKHGNEAEDLYRQAFEKFQRAIDIKPDKHEAFNNWGTYLGNLAQTKHGKEAEDLYRQAFEKFQQAVDCGGKSYNFACLLALKGAKEKAFDLLDLSLSKKEISVSFVEDDQDWKEYYHDDGFTSIIAKYKDKA